MVVQTTETKVKDVSDASLGNGLFARITTSRGDIVINLDYQKSPLAVCNFVSLAEGTMTNAQGKPFYDGLTFHRVISKANGDDSDFMIQGGDPLGNGTGGPGYKFPDETSPTDDFSKPGVVAMANSGKDTNGSQFFITVGPAPWLDGGYTIFGSVVQGQDVADRILKGDKMLKVRIIRNGPNAQAFKTGQAAFDALLEEHNKKAQAAAALQRENDLKTIAAKYPGLSQTADGIQYKIIKQGTGAQPTDSQTIEMSYKATFLDGTPFDQATVQRPLKAKLGNLIPGMRESLLAMKPAEERLVIIPPELAYGSNGVVQQGRTLIPPNRFLVFDMTLLSVQ
jgi:peptidylprolyl isomerase